MLEIQWEGERTIRSEKRREEKRRVCAEAVAVIYIYMYDTNGETSGRLAVVLPPLEPPLLVCIRCIWVRTPPEDSPDRIEWARSEIYPEIRESRLCWRYKRRCVSSSSTETFGAGVKEKRRGEKGGMGGERGYKRERRGNKKRSGYKRL